jgi:hypothetical protein
LKKVGILIEIIVIIVVVYFQPVLFPSAQKEVKYNGKMDQTHKMLRSDNLPTSGCAAYIGKVVKQDIALVKLEKSGLVKVQKDDKGRAREISVREEAVDVRPFKFHEPLASISNNVIFVTNFHIKSNKASRSFELDDTQLNLTPLVRFTNNTYAVLHFSPNSGLLEEIVYMTSAAVLDDDTFDDSLTTK